MKGFMFLLCVGFLSPYSSIQAIQADELEADRILSSLNIYALLDKNKEDFDKNKELKAQLKSAIKKLILKYHPDRSTLTSKEKQKKVAQKLNEFLDDPFKDMNEFKALSSDRPLAEKIPYWVNRIQSAGDDNFAWNRILDEVISNPNVAQSKTKDKFIALKKLVFAFFDASVEAPYALAQKNLARVKDIIEELAAEEQKVKKTIIGSSFGQKVKGFFSSKSTKSNEAALGGLANAIFDVLQNKIRKIEASVSK